MIEVDIALDRTNPAPLFRQVETALAARIATGDLRPGDRLPSERDLAARLGVSRTTTVNAYRELEARGLVRARVGQGTIVCALGAPDQAPFAWQGKLAAGAQRAADPTLGALVRGPATSSISFAAGSPAVDCFPAERFRALLDQVMTTELEIAVGTGPTEGQPILRQALARRAGVPPAEVMVVSGSQQGLDLITRALIETGDTIVMDRPGYLGAIQTFRAAGAQVVGWDARRADPDELESLLQRYRPKFLYTIPTYHNPTGRVLPLATRRAMLALAVRYRLAIVEDEPYRELGFRAAPPPSLHALDSQGVVIHLGTLSKTLAIGLRLGWVIAPAAIIEQLTLLRQRADLFSAGAFQLVAAALLTSGDYDQHLIRLRREHHRRYEAMVSVLRQTLPPGLARWEPVDGGLYLWLTLGDGIDTGLLATRAQAAGVTIINGAPFYPDGGGRHELRLCFARCPLPQIATGVGRLAQVITHDPAIRARGLGQAPLV